MNILITICARAGSKGIPGKNIKPINEKPLIAYTIGAAQEFAMKYKADIALSTDSNRIREVAAEYGLNTDYVRPKELATDTIGKIDVIRNLVDYQEELLNKEYDFILDLDITSPLRTQEDLSNALNELVSNNEAINIFSVSPAARNPYFNMVEKGSGEYVKLVKHSGQIKSRQKAPKVYDMNASFYFFRRRFFSELYETSITDKSLAYVMNHLCFDLDEPNDFIMMDLMLRHNLLDFKF
jgi:CMP-N,N'-diacetyllegionaminic acid synthase